MSKQKFTILLILLMFICGCTPVKNSETKKDEISFNGLDDAKLQDYIIETLQSGSNANFTSDEYEIVEVTTTYLSKEYLEEIEYNSQVNIFFGFTEEEIDKQFKGKKYVFTLGENNETTIKAFEKYKNPYHQMIKNVAIGSGVILICTTISIVSTGSMVTMIFATGAKTAGTMAVSSATLTGVISTAVEYYGTKDFEKAFEAGLIESSESFKWGAIIGAATGGITETFNQIGAIKDIKNMNFYERGKRAEARALQKYGGKEQVSYLNGKVVASNVPGATKPDLVKTLKDGTIEAIEIKNYNLNIPQSRKNLVKEIDRQVTSRVANLPKGSKQRIVLDIQGRNYDKKIVDEVIENIKNACDDVYPNLPVELMT